MLNTRKRRGFTLIELLVALVIMGILVGVGVVLLTGVISNSNTSAGQQQAQSVLHNASLSALSAQSSSITLAQITAAAAAAQGDVAVMPSSVTNPLTPKIAIQTSQGWSAYCFNLAATPGSEPSYTGSSTSSTTSVCP
jgi:prepilin-type N-terminal cleavage/methylation domain-containing protein